jgi:YVTN family beta-propeller protein
VQLTHPSGTRVTSLALTGRPHGVAAARGGTFYVSQIGAASVTRGALTADGESFSGSTAVGAGPAHVALDVSGSTAYTTNQFDNSLSVVDVASGRAVATVPLSDGGFNLLVSPDGARVYATTASGTLHVIDAADRHVLTTVFVGSAANGLAYAAKANVLYVSSRDAGTVTAIDVRTNAVVRTYPVSASPQRLAVSGDGSALYIASESVGLERLDTATGERRSTPGVPPGAVGLALSPDDAQLYVTNPPAGLVHVVDRATGAVLRTLTVAASPRNVAFGYDGSTAVITDEVGRVVFVR